jgi:hypothetical protein
MKLFVEHPRSTVHGECLPLHPWLTPDLPVLSLSSYMHCEWATLEQLERDKRIHQKLKRFKAKHAQMRHLLQEVRE